MNRKINLRFVLILCVCAAVVYCVVSIAACYLPNAGANGNEGMVPTASSPDNAAKDYFYKHRPFLR
jgi:hypothetical protein